MLCAIFCFLRVSPKRALPIVEESPARWLVIPVRLVDEAAKLVDEAAKLVDEAAKLVDELVKLVDELVKLVDEEAAFSPSFWVGLDNDKAPIRIKKMRAAIEMQTTTPFA